ncbi:MAG TPA: HAMP domain-containing sensor histidine kinase [Polyangiales bacterium]|nr:HAMP domain-containing sensor histidine kinase [Polyangiales bacterium]
MSELAEAPAILETPRLDQLIDRVSLTELCRSFFESFEVPVRVYGAEGALLAQVPEEPVLPGGRERTLPIQYDGSTIGELVVGPLPFPERRNNLDKLSAHFSRTLDAVLFAGHKAFLASTMHLATASENFRELSEKNAHLQQAYDKLKELDRLKSTFLATMSHELRTPLTSIIGYSEMLASGMGGDLNPTQREFVDTVRAKGDQLLELILTLLDVAKLENDKLRLTVVKIEPSELARDVLRTVTPTASKKGIQLEHRIETKLPTLKVDKTRMRQVLLNLLDNAIKFTPSGGMVRLEVVATTMARPEDANAAVFNLPQAAVQFSVRDTGIGIAAGEHDKIFDAFYQVDGSATREHGGAGLGLSIVKRLVEGHAGTIEVESVIGQGTTFIVKIPVED